MNLYFLSTISLSIGLIFSACTQSPGDTSSKVPDSNTVIDDFNQRDTKSNIPSSIWTTYNDMGNGGASKIRPRMDAYPNTPDYQSTNPDDTIMGAMKFTYKLDKGSFKWDPFVGFSLNFKGENVDLDFNEVEGIQFWTRGSDLTLIARLSSVADYANYQIKISGKEEWTLVQIPFAHLQQPSWGAAVDWNPKLLTNFDWMLTGADGQEGTLELDQISWMMKGEYKKPESKVSEGYFKNDWTPAKDTNTYLENPQYGIQKVAPWYGFKKGAYALTFDDALTSHYREAAPILDSHDIKATFFLLTNFLGDDKKAPTWRFGYWDKFLELQKNGHDLAGHDGDALTKYQMGDYTAPNTVQYQLASSRINLETRIPGYRVMSYAYPMVAHNQDIEQEALKYYPALRSGQIAAMSSVDSLIPWSKLHSRVIQFSRERSEANDRLTLGEIQAWIQAEVIDKGQWHIFTAHDVLPLDSILAGDPGYHSISTLFLTEFADWLQQKSQKGELWVAPMSKLIQYIKEANSASWGVIRESEEEIVLNLKDQMEDAVYTQALSLTVKVPSSWNYLTVSQNGQEQIYGVNGGIAKVNLIPDGGLITLKMYDIEKARAAAENQSE